MELQYSELQRRDEAVIFVLPANLLNLSHIHQIQEEWLEFIQHEQPPRLILDMHRVTACGSDAISGIVRLAHNVREYGGEIRLCRLNDRVREVLTLSRLIGPILQVDDTLDESLEA